MSDKQKKFSEKQRQEELKSLKAKRFCVVLVVVLEIALIAVNIGFGAYIGMMKRRCKNSVKAQVIDVQTETELYHKARVNQNDNVYRTNAVKTHTYATIEVETDGIFKQHTIEKQTAKYHKSQDLKIYYDPKKPDRYYISGDLEYYSTSVKITSVIAFLWLGVCYLIIRLTIKASREFKSKYD